MLLVLALAFPSWWVALRTAVPGAVDPLGPRLLVSVLCGGTIATSFRDDAMARSLEGWLTLNATVAAMTAVGLAWTNDQSALYAMQLLAALGVGALFVRTRPNLVAFWTGVGGAMMAATAWTGSVPATSEVLGPISAALFFLHVSTTSRETLLHEQIVERTSLLREVFENATDALMLLDPASHQILLANARATEIFRAPELDALLDRDARALPARPLLPEELEAMQAATEDAGEVRIEIPFRRFQGSPFWGDAVWRAVYIGPRPYLLLRITPIDDRIRVQSALEAARDAAEAATIAKSNFLASMSHEIRTPLNGVLGLAQLLERTDLREDQKAYVSTILASGRTLLSLIDELLDFSRIEAGELVIVEEPFDLRGALEDLRLLFRAQAEAKDLALAFELEADLPARVVSDSKRVKQVLVNLLGNAIKFTERGEVVMRVDRLERPGSERSWLRFEVTDTGIGIPEKDMSRIFEPFSQGDPGISRRYGGTGLGLAISRTIAERLGGRLVATSLPGTGSTFTFEIPAKPLPAAPTSHAGLAVHEGPVDRLRPVLVAEDNEVNRMVVVEMLRRLGCDVDVAADGARALERIGQRTYDVIFMDVMMPDLDGLEATRRLRRMPLARRPYVVALTAGVMPGDRERCAEAGMDDFVAKPVQLDEVRKALLRAAESERVHRAIG
jgi:signal transduction histidine kinase/ActR/RegA family two-component response regulator